MPNHIEETADSDCPEATCSALVRRCNVCNSINAVELDATPERWAEMQRKDHTVWHVDEETAIKLWNDEGGKCDHAKLIAELRAKLFPQNA
jgi:hypothetical protein